MNSKPAATPPPGDRPLLHGVDWAVRAGVTEQVMLGTRRRVRRRRQRYAAVAGVVGAIALAIAWLPQLSDRTVAPAAHATSAVIAASPARQTLPDGSVVELNRDASITVEYSGAARRVNLLRGEAHFTVVKDHARPFIVAVDSVEVRAVGTSFAVLRGAAQVEVLVTTGRVAIDQAMPARPDLLPAGPQTIATLDAGNRTRVDVAPQMAPPVVENLSGAEIAQRLAWRVPRLEFTSTPLAEAVPMINRHSVVQLSLADPALGSVRISGLLRVDNIETLFRLLEAEHGIVAEHRGPHEIVLRAGR